MALLRWGIGTALIARFEYGIGFVASEGDAMEGLGQALAERGDSGEGLDGWCGSLTGWAIQNGATSMFRCVRVLL